jgi:hypothetical protein
MKAPYLDPADQAAPYVKPRSVNPTTGEPVHPTDRDQLLKAYKATFLASFTRAPGKTNG